MRLRIRTRKGKAYLKAKNGCETTDDGSGCRSGQEKKDRYEQPFSVLYFLLVYFVPCDMQLDYILKIITSIWRTYFLILKQFCSAGNCDTYKAFVYL